MYKVLSPLALFIICLLSFSLLAEESISDSLSVKKKAQKREPATAVGKTFHKVFGSSNSDRVRRSDKFKRNSLGTKESTFSIGFEVEPYLICGNNFNYSRGGNLLFGGSIDHYNKWLFLKLGIQVYTLGVDDHLYGRIKDDNIFSFSLGVDYKSYFPKTVDNLISPYILVEMKGEAIIWQNINSASTSDNTVVSNYVLGSGSGVTLFSRSNFRFDINISAGVKLYQKTPLSEEEEGTNGYRFEPLDMDFYVRSGFIFWITRED